MQRADSDPQGQAARNVVSDDCIQHIWQAFCHNRRSASNERARGRLLDAEQLHIEHERGAGRNPAPAGTAISVAKMRWNDQSAALADPHAFDTLIPASNHKAFTEGKAERPRARRIELPALVVGRILVIEPAGVMHDGHAAAADGLAVARLQCLHDELGGRPGRRRLGCLFLCLGRGVASSQND
jgi:hypothetical protein